jgi:predicted DNA-binding ribbon-helix-helix protein
MGATIVRRSVIINRHKTCISLENAFMVVIKSIAAKRNMSVSALVAEIDSRRSHGNLSSAVRLYVLDYYRHKMSEEPLRDHVLGAALLSGSRAIPGRAEAIDREPHQPVVSV